MFLSHLPVCKITHAISYLGCHVEDVSGSEKVLGRGLVATAGGDCVHAMVASASAQESLEVAVTHVFHYHVQWF